MFSKLIKTNKKDEADKNKITFCINKIEENGKTYLLRFKKDMWEFANNENYPYQVGIATPIHNKQNGFPTKEENEQLLIMERNLEKEFTDEDIAIFVGSILGGGMKEFIFYTNNPNKIKRIFNRLTKEIKHHELQMIIKEDINWEFYKNYGPQKK